MSKERFELLAENYEAEQADLKKILETLKTALSETEENESHSAKFIVMRQKVKIVYKLVGAVNKPQ